MRIACQANTSGLDAPELIKQGRHLCYGISKQDQLTYQVNFCVEHKELKRLKILLEEAAEEDIYNDDIQNARNFLVRTTSGTRRPPRNKYTGIASTGVFVVAQEMSEEEVGWRDLRQAGSGNVPNADLVRKAYATFIDSRGVNGLSKFVHLRKENDFAKNTLFKKKVHLLGCCACLMLPFVDCSLAPNSIPHVIYAPG